MGNKKVWNGEIFSAREHNHPLTSQEIVNMEAFYKGYNIEITPGTQGWYYKVSKSGSMEWHTSTLIEDEKLAYIYARRIIDEMVKQIPIQKGKGKK